MAFFGPPNIDKLYKGHKIDRLINIFAGPDQDLGMEARNALLKIASDQEKKQLRMRDWTVFLYNHSLKKIGKLNSDMQMMIEPLIRILKEEKESLDKKESTKVQAREELKEKFMDAFSQPLVSPSDLFFDNLRDKLGEDQEFIYTKKMLGSNILSSYSGIFATNYSITWFDLGSSNKIVHIPFKKVKELKYGKLKDNVKIIGEDGQYIKLDIDKDVEKIISSINNLKSGIN